jgi:hypothetical protein
MRYYALGLTLVISIVFSAAANAESYDGRGHYGDCTTTDPGPYQVFIYTDPNFKGTCAALEEGFFAADGVPFQYNFGLPNDSLSSVKVGANVRIRLFSDTLLRGSFKHLTGFVSTMPPGWDNVTSSMRVEDNSRSPTCNDLLPGEFALFRDALFGSDCVVLYYNRSPYRYYRPSDIGIANDSVSSVLPGPRFPASGSTRVGFVLYRDTSWGGSSITFLSGSSSSQTGIPISYLSNFNDAASSIEVIEQAQIP